MVTMASPSAAMTGTGRMLERLLCGSIAGRGLPTFELRHTGGTLVRNALEAPHEFGGSGAVRPLAVGRDVEPLTLVFLADANPDDQLHDPERHERDQCGPRNDQEHRFELNLELLPDPGIAGLACHPVDDRAGASETRIVEYARGQRSENAAEGVHTEHIECIVGTDQLLQSRNAPETHRPDTEADDERTGNADVSGRRGDRDEPGDGAGSGAEHRRLTLDRPLHEHP